MQTFEVTVHPSKYETLCELRKWCEENTQEFDDSFEDADEADSSDQKYTVEKVLHLLDQYKLGYAMRMGELPVMFYFFNEVDSIHFKLRWSQYL